MFRPLLCRVQALSENTFKGSLYFNALWEPKCLQFLLQGCKIHTFLYIEFYVTVFASKS